MSGGRYGYVHVRIEELADEIRIKGGGHAAPPQLRKAFTEHLRKVAAALKAIEWNDSGDGDAEEAALIRAVFKGSSSRPEGAK